MNRVIIRLLKLDFVAVASNHCVLQSMVANLEHYYEIYNVKINMSKSDIVFSRSSGAIKDEWAFFTCMTEFI